jgi:hypothetical protein
MNPLFLASFITLLALLVYFAAIANVGRARGKYNVQAPATSGHEIFDRCYRVQMNMLEQLMLFLPAFWINAWLISAYLPRHLGGQIFIGLTGGLWVLGRILYARGYYRHPSLRARGFIISLFMSVILLLTAFVFILSNYRNLS